MFDADLRDGAVARRCASLALAAVLFCGVGVHAVAEQLLAGPMPADGVFFLQAGEQPLDAHAAAWGLPAIVLRDNPKTGLALEVILDPEVTSTERGSAAVTFSHSVEFVVLTGQLLLAGIELTGGDFLWVPAGQPIPAPVAQSTARLLLFSNEGYPAIETLAIPAPADTTSWRVVYGEKVSWVAGTAMKAAGRNDVPLKIKHFKNDPVSGARTYLVSVAPGLAIPWEVHDVAEEAYLIEGDYRLPECFDQGAVAGHYQPGGYFYRPPGIAHNGPESGSTSGAVMLIRTPGVLTVELVDGCPVTRRQSLDLRRPG